MRPPVALWGRDSQEKQKVALDRGRNPVTDCGQKLVIMGLLLMDERFAGA